MAVRFHLLLTLGLTTFAVAGCSMMSFGGGGPDNPPPPQPLAAAPMGTVTGMPLPPPDATASVTPPGAVAPSQPATSGGLASLGPSPVAPSAVQMPAADGSGQLGRTDLLGGWTINAAGDSCQLFMTLTTWAGGYRASTRGCTNAGLQTVSAWNMDGNQVQLLNDSGTTLARLYPASKTQLSGQTDGGGPITVSR
jgi:hypothetical protein